MVNVRVIDPVSRQQRKRRLGVYVRVSTDSTDQLNSYSAQIAHYTSLIATWPDCELVDVYADEGITGTKLDRRDDFFRMMRDAKRGMLDEILVKSVSRFARNTKDCLVALRELCLLGVAVKFDKENLNTGALTTELMVSVSGSLAQEESVSLSKNMRWSYQKRMQRGKFITCNAPFGYWLSGKEMFIAEDEAEIVRWIFDSYLAGMNTDDLAEAVTAMGCLTSEGTPYWGRNAINYILQNEKYIGDSLGQKTFATDTFPFRELDNKGQKPQYYAEGTHPAIIDRDTFERAQALMRSRRPKGAGVRNEYPLSRKVSCGNCGTTFRRRLTTGGIVIWGCRKHDENKDACHVGRIPEYEIYAAFTRMASKLKANLTRILTPAISQLRELSSAEGNDNLSMLVVVKEIAQLNEKSEFLSRLRERNLISMDDFLKKNNEISARLSELKHHRRLILEREDEQNGAQFRLFELLHALKDVKITDAFDEQLFADIVERVLVDSQEQVRFQLLGGLELAERIKGKIR